MFSALEYGMSCLLLLLSRPLFLPLRGDWLIIWEIGCLSARDLLFFQLLVVFDLFFPAFVACLRGLVLVRLLLSCAGSWVCSLIANGAHPFQRLPVCCSAESLWVLARMAVLASLALVHLMNRYAELWGLQR